jgi:hypothetical protein
MSLVLRLKFGSSSINFKVPVICIRSLVSVWLPHFLDEYVKMLLSYS